MYEIDAKLYICLQNLFEFV
uniref:Uncharacterized protein n=1 Tax=Arundo donax TaxID=35708 RepID=A0A0A9HQX7_ARUDO